MKKFLTAVILFSVLLFLIIFPINAVNGSVRGLLLWFNTITPTLLPFIIISNLLIEFDLIHYITYMIYPLFGKLFRISQNGCYALIIGLLCGFPMGGKICGDLVLHKKITREEGEYLLSFCNNPSPMYMISFVLISSLHAGNYLTPLLLCVYIPIFFSGILYRLTIFRKPFDKMDTLTAPHNVDKIAFDKLDEAIMNGFRTMLKLGGYVILFSIIAEIVSFFPFKSKVLHYLTISLMEITNGTELTALSSLPFSTKILLLIPANCFGGLSCVAQTYSMIKDARLSIVKYILCKLFTAMITAGFLIIYFF